MPNFDRAQNTATHFLLQQDLDSLYIDVRRFKLPTNYYIESMQNFCQMTGADIEELRRINEGACLLRPDAHNRIILYDDELSNEQRKHWGIVHELGHALLGHTSDDRDSEVEAHFFAAQIVAPEIVLCEIAKRQGSLSSNELLGVFNISAEAAAKRIRTLNRRCGYNSAQIDLQLLDKFSPVLEREFSFRKRVS